MVTVVFTTHLERYMDCPTQNVPAGTLREVLDSVFEANPRLKSYLMDDQSRLRKHVIVFIDARQATDRDHLSDEVKDGSEVCVMQALSGGGREKRTWAIYSW